MEWVIGDVHGCFVELLTLLQTLRFRPHAGDKAWFVGDLVDRGPASKEVVDFVREGQAQCCQLKRSEFNLGQKGRWMSIVRLPFCSPLDNFARFCYGGLGGC
ncbi:MAG: metallophosphoesterase [Firmicutes bacterium]|nr:metallophosphoesterase [Bacillota bacterium]